MSKSGVMAKPAVVGAPRSDTKKVKSLVETFPCLSEEEAALLLQQYNGSLKLALEAAINGERWKKIAKPKKSKREEKPIETASPTDRPPRKEFNKDHKFKERSSAPPRADKANEKGAASAPSTTEVKEAVVHQTGVSTTSWVKGKSMSFADMLKKQSPAAATAAAAEVPAPAPSPAAPSPKATAQEKATPKNVASTETAAAAVADASVAPTSAAQPPRNSEGGDATAAGKKPRRERKPRDAAPSADGASSTSALPAASAATVVPAAAEAVPVRAAVSAPPARAAVPAAAAAPAAPQAPIVKYVLELDRIKESVSLPTHVEELALRFSASCTFSATPGRAPTPPPPQVPVALPTTQQANFAVTLNQGTRQAWPGSDANGNQQQQQQQQQRLGGQQQQSHWSDNHAVNAWGRPSPPANFTTYQSYQQAQYRPQPMNYRYNNNNNQQQHHGSHHHHHNNRHPEQVASDLAYNAIRDEQPRFNPGVW